MVKNPKKKLTQHISFDKKKKTPKIIGAEVLPLTLHSLNNR